MAKTKGDKAHKSPKSTEKTTTTSPQKNAKSISNEPRTLEDLRKNGNLWYKICVLIYDLVHMSKDKTCENRTLQTLDALYISAPYFSAEEAATVKSALIDVTHGISVEQSITTHLENFFTKRRASGDWRPCGPHDMAPIYLSCFAVDRTEIEDEKFVSRLRRNGLRGG